MLGEPLNALEITFDSIVTPNIKQVALAMQAEDAQLAEIAGVFPSLHAAGISLPLTVANIPSLVQQLAIHNVILKRVVSRSGTV